MHARRLNHVRGTRERPAGSALILTVVLTSLLAIVGVLFIMTVRIDRMASSAASENEQLGLAVETVVSQIGEVLAADVPGMPGNPSYYDYPDANNAWLADLEPYKSGSGYYWRQVTNLTGTDQSRFNNVPIKVIAEREPIGDVNASGATADADGDGVADARWYPSGVTSSKGRPIYAAVRIIDDGGMLNLNTAWWAPLGGKLLDGSNQLQIDLVRAIGGGSTLAMRLNMARDPNNHGYYDSYGDNVIWEYPPYLRDNPYTPFDVSDDLEMRYRFLLHHDGSASRAEAWGGFANSKVLSTPVDAPGQLGTWFYRARAAIDPCDPNAGSYAWRHAVTTYNMDRILTPRPIVVNVTRVLNKKVNVNTAAEADIHAAVLAALTDRNPGNPTLETLASQITANLRDYIDDDNEVSQVPGPGSSSGAMFYGFERPCVYLSEVAYRFTKDQTTGSVSESYAIELYKPYFPDGDLKPDEWQLVIAYAGAPAAVQPVVWSGIRRFHVLRLQNILAPLPVDFQDAGEAAAAAAVGFVPNKNPIDQALAVSLQGATKISLQRKIAGDTWLTVDFKSLPDGFALPLGDPNDPNSTNGKVRCLQRDISDGKRVLRLWSDANAPNLGNAVGNYVSTTSTVIQAYPANRPLINIGELGMVFAVSAYGVSDTGTPDAVLVNLSDPGFADLFNYLTVMDPSRHGLGIDETRIMGRINVNTAPWRVLAALPWIQYPRNTVARAQAIVSRREALGAYKSIGDLMQVPELQDLSRDGLDDSTPVFAGDPNGPDLTPDAVRDDFEERDILFTRFSDLVTVRSDVFTAYILVRIGLNGPQKRMVALLDRSKVSPVNPKVDVIALHAVADPR
jgi:hypothetical protein